jgi:hypothetical protein
VRIGVGVVDDDAELAREGVGDGDLGKVNAPLPLAGGVGGGNDISLDGAVRE